MKDKKTKFNELKDEIWETYMFLTNCMRSSSGRFNAKAAKYDPGKVLEVYTRAANCLLEFLSDLYLYEEDMTQLSFPVKEVLEIVIDDMSRKTQDLNYKVKNDLDAVKQSSAYIIVIDRLLKIRNLVLECIALEEESK